MAVLSEVDLRSLSKQFGTLIPRTNSVDDKQIEKLVQLLQELFESAEAVRLVQIHRAAACNALCGFIDALSDSKLSQVRSVGYNDSTWTRLLSLYLDRFHEASARSMKQILSTLTKLLSPSQTGNAGGAESHQMINWTEEAATTCLNYISVSRDLSCLKPSMLLLEAILHKSLIPYTRFLELVSSVISPAIPVQSTLGNGDTQPSGTTDLVQFVKDVLDWITSSDVALLAGRLLRALFKYHARSRTTTATPDGTSPASDKPLWLQPILDLARDDSTDLEKLEKYILPELLSVEESGLLHLAKQLPMHQLLHQSNGGISETNIRLALLLVKQIHQTKLSSKLNIALQETLHIPLVDVHNRLALRCIQHKSPHVRIAAASILILSDGATAAFPEDHLKSLRKALQGLFPETDAKVRGDLTSLMRRLTERLFSVINKVVRSLQNRDISTEDALRDQMVVLHQHHLFTTWLFDFLCTELRPSASYQRHVMALKTLNMDSTIVLFSARKIEVFTAAMVRQLIEMALDAYDDVRSLAAGLLRQNSIHHKDNFDIDNPDNCISVARKRMIDTGRASISDGYARLAELSYHLSRNSNEGSSRTYCTPQTILSEIRDGLEVAMSDLSKAVAKPNLHGQFSALRYIVSHSDISTSFNNAEEWRQFQNNLLQCCSQAWEIVKPVLCIDSPEGHGDEEDASELDIGVKDTLSFSWRTLKETSALMQAVLSNAKYGVNGTRALQYEDYKTIGDLLFVQLSELRHRGAFSTVAQCFTTCCIECGSSLDADTRTIPHRWYKETLSNIHLKASALTRRSAGLPAIMVAILASDPQGEFFDMAIRDVQEIASMPVLEEHEHGKTALPQVHAMNCLKDIFANTRLGPSAEKHLEMSLQIAVRALKHDIWAIRNCGGMLLKAMLNRLSNGFNSDTYASDAEHRTYSRTVYSRFPIVAVAVEELLQESVAGNGIGTIQHTKQQVNNGFPALAIIDRIGVKEDRQEQVTHLLYLLLGSSVWSLRERAAATLSHLVDGTVLMWDLYQSIMLDIQSDTLQSNSLHGHLVCMRIGAKYASQEAIASLLKRLFELHGEMTKLPCPYTRTAFLELWTELFEQSIEQVKFDAEWDFICKVVAFWKEACKVLSQPSIEDSHQKLLIAMFAWISAVSYEDTDVLEHRITGPNGVNPIFILEFFNEHPCTRHAWPMYSQLINNCLEEVNFVRDEHKLSVLLLAMEKCMMYRTDIEWREWCFRYLPPYVLAKLDQLVDDYPSSFRVVAEFKAVSNNTDRDPYKWTPLLERSCLSMGKEFDIMARFEAIQRLSGYRAEILEVMAERQNLAIPDWDDQYCQYYLEHIFWVLYDALTDDDNEIRELAADLVSYLLAGLDSRQDHPAIDVCSAEATLFSYIERHHLAISSMTLEALTRVLGLPGSVDTSASTKAMQKLTLSQWISNESQLTLYLTLFRRTGPIVSNIEATLIEDNRLFGEERQNLYKDNVQEMEMWADILMAMQSPGTDYARIYDWAVYGLEMIERSNGSPGWAHRQEGFEAVCRALIFAQVTQSWSADIQYLRRLRDALLGAEEQLGVAHMEHTKLINALKSRFEEMDLDEVDEHKDEGNGGQGQEHEDTKDASDTMDLVDDRHDIADAANYDDKEDDAMEE